MRSPAGISPQFAAYRARLRDIFDVTAGPEHTRTIVVIPSFTVDSDLLASSPELEYWEHRMLHLLPILRNPAVRVVYLTSREISRAALDYYIDLFPGLSRDSLSRLTVLTCADETGDPLAMRLLRRPDLVRRVRDAIAATDDAYIECFASTEAESDLARALDAPLYGPDPAHNRFGLKSQSKALFRSLGIPTPRGIEGVRGLDELAGALAELRREQPHLHRAVVKLDDSLGGVGNAVFSYAGCPLRSDPLEWVARELEHRLQLAMTIIDRGRFLQRVSQGECIVESYIERTRSPSVQCEIRPDGEVLIASTHEQHLTGALAQHFSGCSLPARNPTAIQDSARLVALRLRDEGIIGWFGMDFVVVEDEPGPRHYAIEINLRNVGTAHHLMTLRNLAGGDYDPVSGTYVTADSQVRCYYGSDSVVVPEIAGLPASELLNGVGAEAWAYRESTQTGTVLHMIDAAKPYGRLGLTCIGRDSIESDALFADAVRGLRRLGANLSGTARRDSAARDLVG